MIDQETLGASLAYINKALEALKSVVHYLGVTTTTLSDGATTNPITINGRSVTAVDGDMVFYNGTAYTWNGTAWQETLSIAQIITQIEELQDAIGNLSNLTTEEKSNLVGAINEIVADIPTKLSDLADDATHRLVTDTEKNTWDAKATTSDITNAINALDVASVGGTGKYISAISETDGKISATVGTMDDAPTENSNAPVKSGGIKTAIDDSVSLKTATGNPITLTDAANANAEELSMTIEPIQSGSGDPSPTNVRPISGLTIGEVQTTNGTDTNTATITFGQTVYGGSVNFKTGEVTVTHGIKKFSEMSWYKGTQSFYTSGIDAIKIDGYLSDKFLSDYYTPVLEEWNNLDNGCCVLRTGISNAYYSLAVRDDAYNTTSDFITAQGDRSICYELATPLTLTLTPAELELLKGNNTITANGAEISIKYYPDNAIGVLAERVDHLDNTTSDMQEQIANRVEIQNNAGFRNSIYRGKNLGTEVTQEQWNAISAGTFDDMYIGDYWTIGGVNYRIAAFDYWLNTGDTNCTTHHVVLVPDTNLYTAKMNDSNVTTGGYVGSKMYTSYITTARNKVISAFGSANILSHRQLFSNAVDGNYASNWAWYDSTIDLMSESMVYGVPIGGKAKVDSINFNIGIDKVQLPLFALDPSRITNRAYWWLRDVVLAADFASVSYNGLAGSGGASNSCGVRPAFGIKA